MFVTISILVDVASISLIALAPYTIYQKRQLRKLGGLRGQQNELRHVREHSKTVEVFVFLFSRTPPSFRLGNKQIVEGEQ